jgi:hypothetical protein
MGQHGEDGDWLVGCTGVGAQVAAVHKGRIRAGRGSGRVGGFCTRTEMIFLFPESIFHSTYKSNNFGKNT